MSVVRSTGGGITNIRLLWGCHNKHTSVTDASPILDRGDWLQSRYIGSSIGSLQVPEPAEVTDEVAMFEIRERARIITPFRENGDRGVSTRVLARDDGRAPTRLSVERLSSPSRRKKRSVQSPIARVFPERRGTRLLRTETMEELETVRERGDVFTGHWRVLGRGYTAPDGTESIGCGNRRNAAERGERTGTEYKSHRNRPTYSDRGDRSETERIPLNGVFDMEF